MAVRRDSIVRNTTYGLAAQATGALFTAGLTLYLVRALGPEGYGVFALALGVGALVVLPADLGISAATARFVAENRGDEDAVEALLARVLTLKLLCSLLVAGALFAAAGPIADAYGIDDLAWPLRGIALSVLGQSLMQLFGAGFVAQGRISGSLTMVFFESAVEAGASVALVVLGAGATGAALGRAAGYAAGALIGVVLIGRMVGRRVLTPRRGTGGLGRIVRYAGALFVVDGAFTLFNQVDILFIGAILGATAAGVFQAPLRLVVVLVYPGLAVAGAVAPRIARHGSERPRVDAFTFALRWLTIAQAALVAPIVVWAGPITGLLLGDGYAGSAAVLRALAPYALLSAIAPLVSVTANYLGEARRRVPVAIATVLVNVVLDLVLIPRIGVVGGAIGTDVAFLLFVGAQLEICRRLLGLAAGPYALTVARSLVAAAGMALTLAVFGTSTLTVPGALAGSVAGALVFVALLALTGELSRADVRLLRSMARRVGQGALNAAPTSRAQRASRTRKSPADRFT